MIAKYLPLSFALVTAVAGSAAAHDADGYERADRAPTTYRAPAPLPPVYSTPVGYPGGHRAEYPAPTGRPGYAPPSAGYRVDARPAEERNELRGSDLNHDGWVTLAEAMQQARRDFRNSDRDQNRVLTPREVAWGEFAHEDQDRNGRISYGEYQDAIRASFYRFDTNRDGVLASYELRQSFGPRSAGWRR